MKKKLFNIHKLIGINVVLFFFLSMFFGILTIFQPYINFWENSASHFKSIQTHEINLDKCVKQVTKRTYFGEDGKKLPKDQVFMTFPLKEVTSTNLIKVINRPNFYLNPTTCKRVRPKTITISKFFDKIHTGGIFNSLLIKIVFGFMSVAVVFLSLSGLFLILKNKYKNGKTSSNKAFFAKYHRLILLYTLPLVFMFGLTGALFNLGVYSSPLITTYLTEGKTNNVLTVQRNILQDPPLKHFEATQKVKTLNLNTLLEKATKEFDDIAFYKMEIYNYNDINARVKFVGYEPKNFFISSMTNETYIVLNGTNGSIIDKKLAKQGTFTEKTLDSIFYLHYLRTFQDIPRIIFALICITILFGTAFAITLWLERAKKDKFSYKVLSPLSYTVILGSILSSALLFALNWTIPKSMMNFSYDNSLYNIQITAFYLSFLFLFIYILIKKDTLKVSKHTFVLSAILLFIAVISHWISSDYNIFTSWQNELYVIFYTDLALIITGILYILFARKLSKIQLES